MRPFPAPLVMPWQSDLDVDGATADALPALPGPRHLPAATRRPSTPASPWPRPCASSKPTAATGCRCCPATASRCGAGSPTTASCRPSPTGSAAHPGRAQPRPGGGHGQSGQAGATDAAARLPGPRGHHRPGSPAAGRPLGSMRWPAGSIPVAVLRHRNLREPDPDLTLADGDRVSLLAPLPARSPSAPPRGEEDGSAGPARSQHPARGPAGP